MEPLISHFAGILKSDTPIRAQVRGIECFAADRFWHIDFKVFVGHGKIFKIDLGVNENLKESSGRVRGAVNDGLTA
jgi:hypothetical protein